MRKVKKICVLSTALLACASAFGGVVAMNYASADETIVIDGASVRMSNPTGIRFETLVEKKDGYTYGTLIIPKTLLNGRELDVNVGVDALNVVAEKWNVENDGYTVVLGGANGENGITNFPMSKYNEMLVARSYAEKEGVYTYSAPVERTLAWVASMALADTTEEGAITNAMQREFLEGICDYVVGSDAFAFAQQETIVVDTMDLTTLYSSTNGSEGLAAIWTSSASDIAEVNANGVVTMKSEGSATITAKIGTKTASVVVKSGAKFAGSITGATDGVAKMDLYDADGAYVATCDAMIEVGAYSAIVESAMANASKAIVSQGENAAFIDDLSASQDGEMLSAKYRVGNATLNGKTINSTDNTYATAKASASGNWAYTTAHSATYGLIMPATTTVDNYSFTTQMTKPSKAQNESGVGITNGEWVLSFQRKSGADETRYGTRINIHFEKLGTSTSYDSEIYCGYWNSSRHDKEYLGGRSEYGNWNNENINASGNTASGVYGNAIWTIERTGDSVQLYADPITTGTGLERKLVLTVTKEGITLANSAWASDSYNRLYNKTYGAFESGSNAIIVEGLKGFFGEGVEHAMAFVSDSRATTSHAVTYKTSMITSKTESWTYNAAAGAYATQAISDYAPTGDYSVEFTINGNSSRGGAGNAGIDLLNANRKGYIRLIFGTDCNNGSGAYLLISDGSTETKTGIILQKDGVDYGVGRFNSSSMSVKVKVVRVGNVITIYAASDAKDYTEFLRIDENGISACDNSYTYLNQSKSALDVATLFAGKATALAGWTTGVNTFRLFHYSSNAYTYNCTMTVNV